MKSLRMIRMSAPSFGFNRWTERALQTHRRRTAGSHPLAELESGEVARLPPLVEVLEVRHGAGGIAEEPLDALFGMALVVVVARRAVRRPDDADTRSRAQQIHPRLLGLRRHFDLVVATVQRVADDHGDGLAPL